MPIIYEIIFVFVKIKISVKIHLVYYFNQYKVTII